MNKQQAESLQTTIESALGAGTASARQLGNGTWVTVIRKGLWFCWSADDFPKYLNQGQPPREQVQEYVTIGRK